MSETNFKNPRKIRVWEVDAINSTYAITEQFRHQITALIDSMENGADVRDLPPSMVPTDELFRIVLCYAYMYDMLLDEHLISSGNKKQQKTIH